MRLAMIDMQRSRAMRARWPKRMTTVWGIAAVLTVCSRISYHMHWSVAVTSTLLAVAIILVAVLLVRRMLATIQARQRSAKSSAGERDL